MVLQSDVDNGIDCVGFPYIRCGTGAYPRRIGMSTTGGFEMHTFAAAGAGFLLAVLWFDLMFDVQTRKHTGEVLPPEVLTSISAYYRRVTTEAYPMNRLVALVMLLNSCRHLCRDRRGRTSVVDRLGLAAIGGQRFRAYHDPHRSERTQAGQRARPGGGAVAARARNLPRSHVQLRADGLRSDPATDRALDAEATQQGDSLGEWIGVAIALVSICPGAGAGDADPRRQHHDRQSDRGRIARHAIGRRAHHPKPRAGVDRRLCRHLDRDL